MIETVEPELFSHEALDSVAPNSTTDVFFGNNNTHSGMTSPARRGKHQKCLTTDFVGRAVEDPLVVLRLR